MDQMKTGRFIAEKRKTKEMTQAELGEKLGVTDKSVSKWERGVCLPDVGLFEGLCKELDCSVGDLFEGQMLEPEEALGATEQNLVLTFAEGIKKTGNFKKIVTILVVFIIILGALGAAAARMLGNYGFWDRNYVKPYGGLDNEVTQMFSSIFQSDCYMYEFSIDENHKDIKLYKEVYKGSKKISSEDVSPLCITPESDKPIKGLLLISINEKKNKCSFGVGYDGGLACTNGFVLVDNVQKFNQWGYSLPAEQVKISDKPIDILCCSLSNSDGLSGYDVNGARDALEGSDVNEDQYTVIFTIK